jgi:hypothetical protein
MPPLAPVDEPCALPHGCWAGLAVLCLLFLLAPSLLLWTCVSRVEVARVQSPNGDVDAVLVEINGGATTGFAYSVRLQPTGWLGSMRSGEGAWLYGAHRSECAYGVNLRWPASDRLVVEYREAERAQAHPVAIAGRTVSVVLRPGVTDAAAPCGGMEYSAGRR